LETTEGIGFSRVKENDKKHIDKLEVDKLVVGRKGSGMMTCGHHLFVDKDVAQMAIRYCYGRRKKHTKNG
jgi:hypothetical protein